jgi:retron-type reverse transcriptase
MASWKKYETGLEDRIADLHSRVHRGAYQAQPSRRVYIPKADGRRRPLGIAALEDKIVQQAVVTILKEIYEVDFKGYSYGFRPGRNPHQALDALAVGIQRERVNWVLDADIRSFFDNLSHEWVIQFVEHRVADARILRLIQKWLKAGTSEDDQWSESKVGTPQGAVVSPLLANVYLHYVFDLWIEAWRKKVARGDVMSSAMPTILWWDSKAGRKPSVFSKCFGSVWRSSVWNYMGFTHYCGRRRSDRTFIVWRKTAKRRMVAKLHALNAELSRRKHDPSTQVGEWLKKVVQGYYQYHAVPGNMSQLSLFRHRVCRLWRVVLNRRSQRGQMPWQQVNRRLERWIPFPRVLHPYPQARFAVKHPR